MESELAFCHDIPGLMTKHVYVWQDRIGSRSYMSGSKTKWYFNIYLDVSEKRQKNIGVDDTVTLIAKILESRGD